MVVFEVTKKSTDKNNLEWVMYLDANKGKYFKDELQEISAKIVQNISERKNSVQNKSYNDNFRHKNTARKS